MITEDYISFETAKLLKEKGFKHWCYKCYGTAVYHKGVPISFDEECDLKDEGLEDEIEYVEGGYLYDFGCDNRKKDAKVYAAPTLQMAMKWLREIHNIIITVRLFNSAEHFYLGEPNQFTADIATTTMSSQKGHIRAIYSTYEEACESAIKYCLENLI